MMPAFESSQAPSSMPFFPIVGVGASAGGLAAFEKFLAGIPENIDPGMAFVLVQHLAPDHKSILAEILGRSTSLPVIEVEDGMAVQPNYVYVIPPGHDMALLNGTLQLLEPTEPRGHQLPIDFFFRSLAQDQHQRAIGVVLSGSGSDGTLGIRAIKSEGGMIIVQKTETAEFDSMPRSAIATGLVDYELPPEEMVAQLMTYTSQLFGKLPRPIAGPEPAVDSSLRRIFGLLRSQTSHDFSQYKPSTIYRRIERRMAVHQIEAIENYVKYLQQSPAEVEALFRDLLIGVTNFFRDPEAFQALEAHVIPQLMAARSLTDSSTKEVLRIWICGCSTGEEAYSIAILLREQMEISSRNFSVQIFATDIDSRAIATARAGLFPNGIASDITPERLSRFFLAEPDGSGYRVQKNIREMLVFSEHDVNKDPPFSKLDLISCRNVLIYLGAELQKKLIPLFHFALKPNGFLFLGSSEGISDFNDLFSTLDRKAKLYQRRAGEASLLNSFRGRLLAPLSAIDTSMPKISGKVTGPVKRPLRELVEQTLLRHLGVSAALVNAGGDILYLHGRTGMYLEPSSGEAGINNILKMAREGLRHELTVALQRVVVTPESVHTRGLSVKTNGHFTQVDLSICPVISSTSAGVTEANDPADVSLYLIILQQAAETSTAVSGAAFSGEAAQSPATSSEAELIIAALRKELHARDEYLQCAQEELESSNEELKSSNEEMQSVNEELQSTNEELETSREEMQSINEELSTVNAELQAKVLDLSRANNDMNNLLSGTGIATVFVDPQLRILRFTPTVAQLINLIPSDVGRPVGHIVSNLVGYDSLLVDAQAVLDSLESRERQVQTTSGSWFMMRIRPYRTLDNVIEGVVITFVDITEPKRVEEALAKANDQLRLAVVVRDSSDAITVHDLDGRIIAWNPSAVRMYGWSEAEALSLNVRDCVPEPLRKDFFASVFTQSREETPQPLRTKRLTKDGRSLDVWVTVSTLVNESGQTYAISTTERLIRSIAEIGE
jgi:two-component system, chemotaxis family, CheB/CheR fusion protein